MAKATLTLDQVRNFCVFDGKPIPAERVKRNAVTCSQGCADAIIRQRMLLMEQSECKYCRRPSTPEERESFKHWRKWVKDQATPEIAKESTDESTTCKHNCTANCPDGCHGPTGISDPSWSPDIPLEYPYTYKGDVHLRRGQRCKALTRRVSNSKMMQIQFEDGETLIVDKMTVSGTKKKYSEKRGRPARVKSTLAAKQQIDEGE